MKLKPHFVEPVLLAATVMLAPMGASCSHERPPDAHSATAGDIAQAARSAYQLPTQAELLQNIAESVRIQIRSHEATQALCGRSAIRSRVLYQDGVEALLHYPPSMSEHAIRQRFVAGNEYTVVIDSSVSTREHLVLLHQSDEPTLNPLPSSASLSRRQNAGSNDEQ